MTHVDLLQSYVWDHVLEIPVDTLKVTLYTDRCLNDSVSHIQLNYIDFWLSNESLFVVVNVHMFVMYF